MRYWCQGGLLRRSQDKGQDVELNIHTHVREDDLRLIGFFSTEEKEIFLKLLAVSGISIKIALSALTIYEQSELKRMIMSKDSDLVKRIPGIGKKLAERIILELQDKFKDEEMLEGPLSGGVLGDDKVFEVRQALKTLGYNSKEINRALLKIKPDDIEGKKVEEILKIALKEV